MVQVVVTGHASVLPARRAALSDAIHGALVAALQEQHVKARLYRAITDEVMDAIALRCDQERSADYADRPGPGSPLG